MTWTVASTPFEAPSEFAQANGVDWATDRDEFLAIGFGNTPEVILRSTDGINWIVRSSPFDQPSSVGYGIVRAVALGLWVAVGISGDGADAIITSPDGITWTGRGNPFNADDFNNGTCVAVKPSNGHLVAGGSTFGSVTDECIATSPDGIVWTSRTSPFGGGGVVNAIAYSPTHDRWIAVGENISGFYTAAYSDDDGATWTSIGGSTVWPSGPEGMNGVYYDSTSATWFILGASDSGASVSASTDNGATWTEVMAPVDSEATAAIRAGSTLALGGDGTAQLALSTDDGATWAADATPILFDQTITNNCFAYSPSLGRAVVGGGGEHGCLAYGLPSAPLPIFAAPVALKNTWRWVVCGLDGHAISFLDRLATNVQVKYVLDDSAEATLDLPSDNPEVYQHANDGEPRVSYGRRLLYGLRREEPSGGAAPWVCRFGGIITILQDEANEDEPITHLTANDPWTWAKTLPVLNADGSLLAQGGLTYKGKTADYIALDLIGNAYAWMVVQFGPTFSWSGLGVDNLPIDISSGVRSGPFATIPEINFAQGISVGDAWTQLCATGTLDIILRPVYGVAGVCTILDLYAQAGEYKPGAVFGWDMFARNLVGVDDLRDGTQLENYAQFFAGNVAAAPQTDATSIDSYGPYYVTKSFPAPAEPASAELLALAEVALRRKGKQTLQIDPTPEHDPPEPFKTWFLGDEIAVWAGRPLLPLGGPGGGPFLPGSALRAGVRSTTPGTHRVYGFQIDLSDDLTETVTNVLLSDPNST